MVTMTHETDRSGSSLDSEKRCNDTQHCSLAAAGHVHDNDGSIDNQYLSVNDVKEKDTVDHARGGEARGWDNDKNTRWEYLTYDTVLPDFVALVSGDPAAPQPPNLKDYDSPFAWSRTRKDITLALSCVATLLAAYSAGSYSFAAEQLRAPWGLSLVSYNTGITSWCLGFGTAPMFLAPFSEINGRRPVFLASGLVFLVSGIGCAVTDSFAGMVVARFFNGAGGSTYATIVGGVMSDIYHAENRNTPMAIYSGFVLAGSGIGPLCGGLIVERVSWTWIFWSHAIVLGVLIACMVVFFKETRGSVLLSRRAKKLNQYLDELDGYAHQQRPASTPPSQGLRYKVEADETRATLGRMIYLSVTTPFKFLATEPVVFFFSLWAAFAWGILYMCFDAVPLVFQTTYGFNITQQAAVFTAVVVGSIIATFISIYQDTLIALTCFSTANRKLRTDTTDANDQAIVKRHNPESRLYLPCILSPCLPIGLFWFGWTSSSTTSHNIPWIVPAIALAVAQIGIFSVYLAVFNYLADSYHRYASSALAGQSFCRNVLAAVFPLFTNQMFRGLGFGSAGSLLGALGLVLTLVPWVLVWKGETIRARSRIASQGMRR